MKEKIEEILDMLFIEETKYKVNVAQSSTVSNTVPDIRSSPEYSAVNIVGKEAVVKLLYTLIQESNKEAVKGFVKACDKYEDEELKLDVGTINHDFVKTYLKESEGVKSNEKDDTPDYTPPMDIKYKDLKDIYKPSITKSESEGKK
jgi:hypothetical protein